MEKKKKHSPELSRAQVLRQDLRLFSVPASSEQHFPAQAAELESDPPFERLCAPGPGCAAPVIRKRFPGASRAFFDACGAAAPASAAIPAPPGSGWPTARQCP